MNVTTNHVLLAQINKLKNLPALPEASLKILAAINNPTISPDDLAKTLALSPSLVARLLGLSNAAYFGQSRKINDLSTAIYQVLGLDLVKSLALSIILNVQFDAKKCHAFNSELFWQHSLFTAVAAQKLANANKLPNYSSATVYTSGLLLQLGILILAYIQPDELDSIIHDAETKATTISQELLTRFGADQYAYGYTLMNNWHLSPIYQAVQKHYTDTDFNGEERKLIDILHISQKMSIMIATDKMDETALLTQCDQRSVANHGLIQVIDYLTEHQQNIQNLADIIGN